MIDEGRWWLFLAAVAGAVLLLLWALLLPLMGGQRGHQRRQLRQRLLRLVAAPSEQSEEGGARVSLAGADPPPLTPFERHLQQRPPFATLQQLLQQAGVELAVTRWLLRLLLPLLLLSLLLWWIGGEGVVLLLPLLILPLALLWLQQQRQQRLLQFEMQLPEAITIMSRALRVGLPLARAIRLAADELPEPAHSELQRTFTDLNYGGDLRRALYGLMLRLPSVAVLALASALTIQRESGGNLVEVLEKIGAVVRARFRFQRRVRTLSAEARLSAWVLTLLPFALFLLLTLLQPGYLEPLLALPQGQQLLLLALLMMLVGALWIRRMLQRLVR